MGSERDLLLKARQFDTCALTEIYDLFSPRLYRYAVRILGDACTAEDCVAETFSRFLQALRSQNGPRDYLQAYLFRTIHNLIVDQFRRQPPVEILTDKLTGCENIEESVDKDIRQHLIRAALRELPPAQLEVLALKFLDGWENEEVAHALNKPIGAIKSLQHRALVHLQKLLLDDEI